MNYTSDESHQIQLAAWMTENADILPSRAATYAKALIDAGCGSMYRVAKKLKKNENFLTDIGFSADDADEIKDIVASQNIIANRPLVVIASPEETPRKELAIVTDQSPSESLPSDTPSTTDLSKPVPLVKSKSYSVSHTTPLTPPSPKSPRKHRESDSAVHSSPVRQISKSKSESKLHASPTQQRRSSTRFNTIEDVPEDVRHQKHSSFNNRLSSVETIKEHINSKLRENTASALSLYETTKALNTEVKSFAVGIVFDLKNDTTVHGIEAACQKILTCDHHIAYFQKTLGKLEVCTLLLQLLATHAHKPDLCETLLRTTDYLMYTSHCTNMMNIQNFFENDMISQLKLLLLTNPSPNLILFIMSNIEHLSLLPATHATIYKMLLPRMLSLYTEYISDVSIPLPVLRALQHMSATLIDDSPSDVFTALLTTLPSRHTTAIATTFLHLTQQETLLSQRPFQYVSSLESSSCPTLAILGSLPLQNLLIPLHMHDSQDVLTALALIVSVSRSDDCLTALLSLGLMSVLLDLMEQYLTSTHHVEFICFIMYKCSSHSSETLSTDRCNGYNLFTRCYLSHMSALETSYMCAVAIRHLVHNSLHAEGFLHTDITSYLVQTMQKYASPTEQLHSPLHNEQTQQIVLQCLAVLRKMHASATISSEETPQLYNSHIHEVLHITILRNASQDDVVSEAFQFLILLTSDMCPRMSIFCKSVLKCAYKHTNSVKLSTFVLQIVSKLAEVTDNIPKLVQLKLCEYLAQILNSFAAQSTALTQYGCYIISLLTKCNVETVVQRVRHTGIMETIIWCLQRQGKHVEVAYWSLLGLVELAQDESNRSKLGSVGCCEAMINISRRYKYDDNIMIGVCNVMYFLALDANNRAWLGAAGACKVLASVLQYHNHANIINMALRAMHSLITEHEGNIVRLMEFNACSVLLHVMREHITNSSVMINIMQVFAAATIESSFIRTIGSEGACALLVECILLHQNDIPFLLNAFPAIVGFVKPGNGNIELFVENNILQAIIDCIILHINNINVCVGSFACMLHLLNHKEVVELVSASTFCNVMMNIIPLHYQNEVFIQYFSQILLVLTANERSREVLICHAMCEQYITALEHHHQHDVVIYILHGMIQLCHNNTFNCLFTKPDLIKIYMRLAKNKNASIELVYVVIMLVGLLAKDTQSCVLLGDGKCCEVLIYCLTKYKDYSNILIESLHALISLSVVDSNIIRISNTDICEVVATLYKRYNTILMSGLFCQLISTLCMSDLLSPDNSRTRSQSGSTDSASSSGQRTPRDSFKPVGWIKNMISKKLSSSGPPLLQAKEEVMVKLCNRQKFGGLGVAECIVQSLYSFIDDEALIAKAMMAMHYMCMNENNVQLFGRSGGCEMLVTVLRHYATRDDTICSHACQTVYHFAAQAKYNAMFSSMGMPELVSMVLVGCTDQVDVIEAACSAIGQLALNPKNCSIIHTTNIVPLLLQHLQTYQSNMSLVQVIIHAFRNCVAESKHLTWIDDEDNVLMFANMVVHYHRFDEIVADAFYVFTELLQHNSKARRVSEPVTPILAPVQRHLSNTDQSESNLDLELSLEFESVDGAAISPPCTPVKDDMKQTKADTALEHHPRSATSSVIGDSSSTALDQEVIGGIPLPLLEVVVSHVVALSQHNDDVAIQLCSLMRYLHGSLMSVEVMHKLKVVDTIMKYLHHPSEHPTLFHHVLHTLSVLVSTQEHAMKFGHTKMLDIVLKHVTKNHDTAADVHYSMKIIRYMVQYHTASQAKMGHSSVIMFVMKVAVQYLHTSSICCEVCHIIGTLSFENDTYQARFLSAGGGNYVHDVLKHHQTHELATDAACIAVASLAHLNEAARVKLGSMGLCEMLTLVLRRFGVLESIVRHACQALALLTVSNKDNCLKIASHQGCERLIEQLQTFGLGGSDASEDIAIHICRAIGNIISIEDKNRGYCHRMGELGACETVVLVLQKYGHSEEAIKWTSWAIMNLNHGKNQEKFLACNTRPVLEELLKRYEGNATIENWINKILQAL